MSEIYQPQEQEPSEAERINQLNDKELEELKQFVIEKYNYAEQTINSINNEQSRRAQAANVLRGWDE